MRALASLLGRVLQAAATGVLVAAAVLLALEHSGWLERHVQSRLATLLGEPLSIRGAAFEWFDAAIEIQGLSLELPGGTARLDRVRAVWRRSEGNLPRLALIEVLGGRLVLGEALGTRLAARPTAEPSAGSSWPDIVVRDLALELAHPALGELPIGVVHGACTRDVDGRPKLEGWLQPSIGVASPDAPLVYLGGEQVASGELALSISTEGLPVSLQRLPGRPTLDELRRSGARGNLDLDARMRIRLDSPLSAQGEIRAHLEDGSLLLPLDGGEVGALAVDVSARLAPGAGEDIASPLAWTGTANATARWRSARIEAFGTFGPSAGPELLGRAWLSARGLALDASLPSSLSAEHELGNTWRALEPRGACDFCAAWELPREGPSRSILELSFHGQAGLTFQGWPHGVSQRRQGFPVPIERVRGRVLAVRDPARERSLEFAIVGTRGAHGLDQPDARTIWIEGQVASRPPQELDSEWILHLGALRMPVDGGLIPAGLAGLGGAEWIWPTFQPRGGEASFEARMRQVRGEKRLTASLDIDLDDVGMTWSGLPIPVTGLHGRLGLVFEPRRPFGAAFEASGRSLTAESVRIAGRVLELERAGRASGEGERARMRDIAIGAENLALRGLDRDTLVEQIPGIGTALDQLGPAGKVDLDYRSVLASDAPHPEFWAEVVPRQTRFSPQAFRVQMRDVRGRVLVSGSRRGRAPDPGAGAATARIRLRPLVGELPGDVLVACDADLPAGSDGVVRVLAAGIEPLNSSLVGALREAFQTPESGFAGVDLSALSLDGRVDAEVAVALPAAPRGPAIQVRVYLRDNDFEISSPAGAEGGAGFGLDRLKGVLLQREGVLSGSGIHARLGRTPLTLNEARFSLEPEGYRLETRLEARELPLDREHLRFFLDPDTVEALVEGLAFRGSLDLSDARLVLVGTPGGRGRVLFEGSAYPRGAHVDFGLPLDVDSAAVEIESLVFERGHVRLWASVRDLHGKLGGRRLEKTRLQLTYVEPHLSILDLSGRLEGGRLADLGRGAQGGGPAFSIDLAEPFPFDLGLRLENVQVEGLLRGLFESEFASRGLLSGEMRLTGSLERVTAIRGDGVLNLRESTLWSIPVMRALFSQLGFDDTAVFERMRTHVQVQDGRVEMSGIQVYSPLLQLVGSGTMDFEGRLHHDLEVRYSLVDRLGPLTRLVYWIQNNLLRVAVRGDMSRPRVELEGFLSFLQPGSDGGRDVPLPALTPLPARF